MTRPFLERLAQRLSLPLPGLAAQLRMMPVPFPEGFRTYLEVGDDCLKGAVLALIYPREGEARLVFIRRPVTVAHHKGQISFPGGHVEEGETYEGAALREAREEIGVDPATVCVLGRLTPLFIPPSGYSIFTFIGITDVPPVFVPQPEEVDEIIEIPLAHLLDPRSEARETWPFESGPRVVPHFAFGAHKIWGATAMVLSELLEILRARA